MVDVSEVAQSIYMIDGQLFSIPRWGSVYLINEEKKALIESGPTTSASVVLEGIRELGIRPEDISYLIVTHIHLDHAGGAGVLARYMPQAGVIVHHKGAQHQGVSVYWGKDEEEQGLLLGIEHSGDTVKLSTRKRDFTLAVSHIHDDDLSRMRKVLHKMNFDRAIRLRGL